MPPHSPHQPDLAFQFASHQENECENFDLVVRALGSHQKAIAATEAGVLLEAAVAEAAEAALTEPAKSAGVTACWLLLALRETSS